MNQKILIPKLIFLLAAILFLLFLVNTFTGWINPKLTLQMNLLMMATLALALASMASMIKREEQKRKNLNKGSAPTSLDQAPTSNEPK